MLSAITRTSAPVRAARLVPTLARCYGDDAAAPLYPNSSNPQQSSQNSRRSYAPRSFNGNGGSRDQGPREVSLAVPSWQSARTPETVPHLLTLADRTEAEISLLVQKALALKLVHKHSGPRAIRKSIDGRSVAMIFSKRSTRTRVATETATATLGGTPMFLGSADIQLGVNESLYDSAKVIGSMVDGIMARVKGHDEVETLAAHAGVPVINALSDLYHPTQILADILTLVETYSGPFTLPEQTYAQGNFNLSGFVHSWVSKNVNVGDALRGKKIAWVGDTNNITNELLVTLPRFGMTLAVAAPKGYDTVDPRVLKVLEEQGVADKIIYTNDPAVAVKDADILVTDTWISMGQEEESAARMKAFEGYQITMDMAKNAGAKPDWKFMHCLPRHKEEVDDEVFYSDRSVVFPEAENRKWTIMACIS